MMLISLFFALHITEVSSFCSLSDNRSLRPVLSFGVKTSLRAIASPVPSLDSFTSSSTEKNYSTRTGFSRRDWFAVTAAALPICVGAVGPAFAIDSSSSPLCNDAVSSWKKGNNRVVHILGTAHISSESAETAGLLVRNIKPNAVFVELDQKRVQQVLRPSIQAESQDSAITPTSPSSFNPIAQIQRRVLESSANAVGNSIRGLYKKLAAEGIDAGQEFAMAIKEGLAQGATVVLGDQDVDLTLQRLTSALTKTNWSKLLTADESVMKDLLPAESRKILEENFTSGDFNTDQFRSTVELVKTRENVRKIMAVLQDTAPEIYMAMVGERDAYMANGLNRLEKFDNIVAVVGLAHVDGIEMNLSKFGWTKLPTPAYCLRVR